MCRLQAVPRIKVRCFPLCVHRFCRTGRASPCCVVHHAAAHRRRCRPCPSVVCVTEWWTQLAPRAGVDGWRVRRCLSRGLLACSLSGEGDHPRVHDKGFSVASRGHFSVTRSRRVVPGRLNGGLVRGNGTGAVAMRGRGGGDSWAFPGTGVWCRSDPWRVFFLWACLSEFVDVFYDWVQPAGSSMRVLPPLLACVRPR